MKQFTFLLLLISNLSFAQTTIFVETYSQNGYEDARGIVATADGGFVFTGLNKSSVDTSGDMYLKKVNAFGEVLWEHFYGYPDEDGGNFLLETTDGGYLITGHTEFSPNIECDAYFVKTEANGNVEWDLFAGAYLDDVANATVELGNGDFYVTGKTENIETGKPDAFLCKITSAGELVFFKNLPKMGSEYGKKIIETDDGMLVIVGYTNDANESGKEQMYVVKCDLEGNVIWDKTIGNTEQHYRAYDVVALDDGSVAIVGGVAANTYFIDYQNPCFAILDQEGTILRFETIEIADAKSYAFDIEKTENNGFVLLGLQKQATDSFGQPILIFLDENFELQEIQQIETLEHPCKLVSMCSNEQGKLGIAGSIFTLLDSDENFTQEELGEIDKLVASFDTEQTIDMVEERSINNLFDSYEFYPNPLTSASYLKVNSQIKANSFYLYDDSGRLVKQADMNNNELHLNRENLQSGVYMFHVKDEKGNVLITGKLQVE